MSTRQKYRSLASELRERAGSTSQVRLREERLALARQFEAMAEGSETAGQQAIAATRELAEPA